MGSYKASQDRGIGPFYRGDEVRIRDGYSASKDASSHLRDGQVTRIVSNRQETQDFFWVSIDVMRLGRYAAAVPVKWLEAYIQPDQGDAPLRFLPIDPAPEDGTAAKTSGRLTSRIPVTPETLTRLREFAIGMDATYDETINALLDMALHLASTSARFAGAWLKSAREKKDAE